jgi:ABC-type lipoprotein release transport system permease subunit
MRHWSKQLFLVIIYAFVVAFYASVVFFTSSLKNETLGTLQNLPEVWIQKIMGGRLVPMEMGLVDSLQNIRGTKSVYPRVWGYNFDEATGAIFTVMGTDTSLVGMDFLETETFKNNKSKQLNDKSALVGTGLLEMRGLEIGDFVSLTDSYGEKQSFQIVGTFEASSDLLTRDLIVLSINSAQNILGLEANQCTDIALEVWNEDEVSNIAKKIDNRFLTLRVVTLEQLRSTYQALFSWRGGIFIYGSLMSVFAFLILAWDKASGLSSEEKKELGILKGIGWNIKDVLLMKLWQGGIISITATLTGIILAYVHVFIFNAPLLKPFLIGWSVLYPAYDLIPVLELGDLLAISFLSVIPYLTATIVPAWKGAITDPSQAMQG